MSADRMCPLSELRASVDGVGVAVVVLVDLDPGETRAGATHAL